MLVILYLNSGFFSFDDGSDGEKTVKNPATAIATATATTKNKNIPTTVGIDKAKALSVSREAITSFLKNIKP